MEDNFKENVIVLPTDAAPLEVEVQDETENLDYIVEEPSTPTVEDISAAPVKEVPLISIANVEDLEIRDSDFVSLSLHDKNEMQKEQSTFPASSEVLHIFLYYPLHPTSKHFYTRNH